MKPAVSLASEMLAALKDVTAWLEDIAYQMPHDVSPLPEWFTEKMIEEMRESVRKANAQIALAKARGNA